MGLPKRLNFSNIIMKKEESQNKFTTSEKTEILDQEEEKVEPEQDSEMSPRKKTKAKEKPTIPQNSQQKSHQDLHQDSHTATLSESQTQIPILLGAENRKEDGLDLRRRKMEFLEKARERRYYRNQAPFWRTSPFEHTPFFTKCVEELEELKRSLLSQAEPLFDLREEEESEKKKVRHHSSRATSAKLTRQALELQNKGYLEVINKTHSMLERTVREEFESEMRMSSI